MNVEIANDTAINTSDDQGSSVAAPATEVNLEHSTSSIVDDLTEDPSAAGSVPPPTTAFHVPWRVSTPPQVLSVLTFADNHGTVIRNNVNRGSENLEGNMQMETRQNSYHDDEDEEISEPLTPQMTSSSRNYTSYHNRLTPKIMGGAAPSLTSSTRSVKSNSSSIVGYYFPDALNMPPSSTPDEIHDTPSIRSDLAGWVIDAPKNAAESNLIENEHQQRGVPLIVEKQPTHSRMSIRSHSHHGSNGSGSGMGGMNSSMLGLRKAIQDVQVKLERSLKDMQESNTRDLERLITVIQQESNKRISSLENRLHAQLLAQSETMVAMELKLLRLESKVERREAMILSQQQRRRAYSYPLAATAIDEEGDMRSDDPNSNLDDGSLETMPPEIQVQKNDNNTSNSQSLRMSGNSGWVNTGAGSMTGPRNNVLGGSSTSNTAHNFQSSSAHNPRAQPSNPRNVAIISSGASLTSAFTATSFLDGEGSTQMDTAYDIGVEGEEGMVSVRSGEGDYDDDEEEVVGEEEFNDGSASTPTQGSSRRMTTSIDAFVLNSMPSTAPIEQGLSIRATRGDYDGTDSTLATSFTTATFSSTAITATTRGGDSIYVRSLSQQINDGIQEDDVEIESAAVVNSLGSREDLDCMLGLAPPVAESHSPITVQSAATASVEPLSLASASVGTSILSTAAVAPARTLRSRRDVGPLGSFSEHRPLANPVVSFTSSDVFSVPPEILGAGDSITMPDELDNISDIADVFADRALRHWREDYEKRLEALQKRWGVE